MFIFGWTFSLKGTVRTKHIYKVKKQKHCISLFQSELNFKCNISSTNQQCFSQMLWCTSCFTLISTVAATEWHRKIYSISQWCKSEKTVFGDLMCWTLEATFASGDYDMWHVICQDRLIIPLQFFEVSYWFTWHVQLWLKAFLKALKCQWNILKFNNAWQAENQSWALCG